MKISSPSTWFHPENSFFKLECTGHKAWLLSALKVILVDEARLWPNDSLNSSSVGENYCVVQDDTLGPLLFLIKN